MKKIIFIISQLILLGFTGTSIEDSYTERKNGLIYAKDQSKPYTGKVKDYYGDSDKVLDEKTYVDGKLEGSYKSYYSNGKVKQKRTYVGGRLEGASTWYFYKSGKVKIKETYVGDKLEGAHVGYHEYNDQVKWKKTYVNGKLEGASTEYHESGKVRIKETYVDGEKEGASTDYHENGQVRREINYVGGREKGDVTYYYENGNVEFIILKRISIYGKREKFIKYYDESGQLKKSVRYKKGRQIQRWYKNGIIIKRRTKWNSMKLF